MNQVRQIARASQVKGCVSQVEKTDDKTHEGRVKQARRDRCET